MCISYCRHVCVRVCGVCVTFMGTYSLYKYVVNIFCQIHVCLTTLSLLPGQMWPGGCMIKLWKTSRTVLVNKCSCRICIPYISDIKVVLIGIRMPKMTCYVNLKTGNNMLICDCMLFKCSHLPGLFFLKFVSILSFKIAKLVYVTPIELWQLVKKFSFFIYAF